MCSPQEECKKMFLLGVQSTAERAASSAKKAKLSKASLRERKPSATKTSDEESPQFDVFTSSSLHHDKSLDDGVSDGVDLRWTCNVVLFTLQVLHAQQKWERLADLAIRFDAITRWVERKNIDVLLIFQKLVEHLSVIFQVSSWGVLITKSIFLLL